MFRDYNMYAGKLSETNSEICDQNSAMLLLVLRPLLDDLSDRIQRHDRAESAKDKDLSRFLQTIVGLIPWNQSLSEEKNRIIKKQVQLLLLLDLSSPQEKYFDQALGILQSTTEELIQARRDNTKRFYPRPGHAERAIQEAIITLRSLSDQPDQLSNQLKKLSRFKKEKMGQDLSKLITQPSLSAAQHHMLISPLQKQHPLQENIASLQEKLESKSDSNQSFKKEDIAWIVTALLITAGTVFLISPWAPWSFGPAAINLIQVYIGTNSYAAAWGFGCLATVFVTLLFIKAVIAPCLSWCAQKLLKKKIETEASKPSILEAESHNLWAMNPIARIWSGIAKFTDWFYHYGLKHPISMTLYTGVYVCTIIDLFIPFLPWHAFNLSILSSLANPATISLVTGSILTAFFLGKVTLAICSLIQERANSPLIKAPLQLFSNDSQKSREALKMLAIIIFGALILCPIIWGQAQIPWIVAHVGNWLIFDLLMFNIKPLAILGDTCSNFESSVLGSTVHVITLPLQCLFKPFGYRRLVNDLFKIVVIRATLAIPDILFNKFILPIPHVLIKGFCAIVTDLLRLFCMLLPGVSPNHYPFESESSSSTAEKKFENFHKSSKEFFKACVTKAEGWVDGALPPPAISQKSMPPVTSTKPAPSTLGKNQKTAPVVPEIKMEPERVGINFTPV